MTLEKLIERDMVSFIESAAQKPEERVVSRQEDAAAMQANRDYVGDIKTAIKRNDLDEAKRIFNSLKERYNSLPPDHETERALLYKTLQSCYLLITNFVQDRSYTTELLSNMENVPVDVFNTQVKPIDLAHIERVTVMQQSAIAGSGVNFNAPNSAGISMPGMPGSTSTPTVSPIPSSPAESTARPGSTMQRTAPSTPNALEQNASLSPSATKSLLQSILDNLKDALRLSKTNPTQALTLIATSKNSLEQAIRARAFSPAQASSLAAKIDLLKLAIEEYEERRAFQITFNADYTNLMHLCRSKDSDAVTAYHTLLSHAQEFEKMHPNPNNSFTRRLQELHDTFHLYTEDELVEELTPLIKRLRTAKTRKDVREFSHALEEVSALATGLPRTAERAILEQLVLHLRERMTHSSKIISRARSTHA